MKHILILVGIVLIIFSLMVFTKISPHEKTKSVIAETFVRIDAYMKSKQTIPVNLKELPTRKGYTNSVLDAWGNRLIYSIDSEGIISLSSYGEDGKIGGVNKNKDIVIKYKTRDTNGDKIILNPNWLIESRVLEE